MMAGAKPTLITQWPLTADNGGEDYTQLQPLIDSGQIVVAGINETSFPHHIICHPEDLEAAKKGAIITSKMWNNLQLEDSEINYHNDFLKNYCGISLPEDFNARSKATHLEPHLLLNKEIRTTLALMTGVDNSFGAIPALIADKISAGELCAVHVNTDIQSIAVLAQRDCLDMGKELFARYYKNDEGYEPLSNEAGTKRVGELLGYTQADTDFFLGAGTKPMSQHSLGDRIQITLFPLLRDIRAETMIYNANQPK